MPTLYEDRPFNLRYSVLEHAGRYRPELLRTFRTAQANWLYINRQKGAGLYGPLPDWSQRDDLIATGRCGPKRSMDPALAGVKLWLEADLQAQRYRPCEPVCAHAVGSLPMGLAHDAWIDLITGFCEDYLTPSGMIVDWAIHARDEDGVTPAIAPHVHLLITTRVYDRQHAEFGRLRQTWLRTEVARKRLGERWWTHTGLYPQSYRIAA